MFTSKLLLFLVLASCALFAFGRSIPRGAIELDESPFEGFRNDGEATSIWKNDGQTNLESEDDLLTIRGFLDSVKNKANQAKQKAQEYKDKAKEKVDEMKNKAGSVMKNLPGLVQRKFIDLKNVMEDYSEPLFESGDGILNNLEDVNQETDINDARERISDAMSMNIEDDHKLADDNYNAQLNMYIADTVDGEVAGEGYGLYEDELNEQDDYLEDVGELKDESSGSRTF